MPFIFGQTSIHDTLPGHSISWLNLTVIGIIIVLLSGCASQTPRTTSPTSSSPPHEQRPSGTHSEPYPSTEDPHAAPEYTTEDLQQWQVQGKLGIRVPGDSGSVYFNWKQGNDDFAIHLSGPLGQGSSWLHGNEHRVSLQQGNREPVYADNMEALMHSTLGWALPVSELYFWIRGIPAPDIAVTHQAYNDANRLVQLQQQGWQLTFERYRQTSNLHLPGKLIAKRDNIKLTFIIKNWTLDHRAQR